MKRQLCAGAGFFSQMTKAACVMCWPQMKQTGQWSEGQKMTRQLEEFGIESGTIGAAQLSS